MKPKILFLILFAVSCELAIGQNTVTRARKIDKSYAISQNSTVEIENKYGNVELRTWAKDSVRFKIKLVAKARNEDKLERLMSIIKFKFTDYNKYLKAHTEIGSSSGDLLSELTNLTNAIFTIGTEAIIDYEVYVPRHAQLKIVNSFGDVFINDLNRPVEINLSHGDLRASTFSSEADIEMKFGKAYISHMKKASLNLSFAELNLKTAEDLHITSKGSEIDIERLQSLKLDSRRDEIEIEELNDLRGNTYFSKIYIEEFRNNADMDLNFGSFNMESVNRAFSNIYIKADHADINLVFEKGSSYQLYVKHSELDLNYPTQNASVKTYKTVDDEVEYKVIKGQVGNAPGSSKLKVEAQNGELKIYHR